MGKIVNSFIIYTKKTSKTRQNYEKQLNDTEKMEKK